MATSLAKHRPISQDGADNPMYTFPEDFKSGTSWDTNQSIGEFDAGSWDAAM